jgi:hypothetical protein
MMRSDFVMPTQRQIHYPILCGGCEDILNNGGETWAVPRLATQMGAFPLFDLLTSEAIICSDPKLTAYSAARIPAFRTDKLAHLALGIFYKSAVHTWQKDWKRPPINLRHYANPIASYLRNEGPFPNNIALVLTLTPPPVKEACFTVPREMQNDSARHFFFYLPGLKFDLAAGPNIRDVKSICFHSSDRKVVCVEDLSKEIKAVFSVGLKNSYRTQKFHEYIAILNSRRR